MLHAAQCLFTAGFSPLCPDCWRAPEAVADLILVQQWTLAVVHVDLTFYGAHCTTAPAVHSVSLRAVNVDTSR